MRTVYFLSENILDYKPLPHSKLEKRTVFIDFRLNHSIQMHPNVMNSHFPWYSARQTGKLLTFSLLSLKDD